MTVKLHVGYIGKTRDGGRVGPVTESVFDGLVEFRYKGKQRLWNKCDGTHGDSSSHDPCIENISDYDIIGPWEEPRAKVGEWIGWNGGECPVHPETVVEVVGGFDTLWKTKAHHKLVAWENVIAYRVITPYVEPKKAREFWVDPVRCIGVPSYHAGFIHVREVLDDDNRWP